VRGSSASLLELLAFRRELALLVLIRFLLGGVAAQFQDGSG
jgi:hypothetical protein